MPKTKEEIRLQRKAQRQTPQGKKTSRKAKWKEQGIIIKNFDEFYEMYLSTTHCQICQKELTIDKKITHSTKCVDHNHNINDRENVRYICCTACNANDRTDNTSGIPNIHFTNNYWIFNKIIKGVRFQSPPFKTKQEAINYKVNFDPKTWKPVQTYITNTSGESNIYYYTKRDRWYFTKVIKGVSYRSPYFKTKEEAIDYKNHFVVDNVKTTAD